MLLIVGCAIGRKWRVLGMRNQVLKAFGQEVRHWRNAQSLFQEELAHRGGFHRTYIGQVERGERNPSLLSILALCQALEVSLPEFFTRYKTGFGTAV